MAAKILVADDDADLLDVVRYVLRRHAFEVVTAADGVQALDAFAQESPDLVVLDVHMPRLDGFEVCRRIRAESNTPVIMLTVRNEDADVVGALRLGADDYVTKPFSTSQLVARVEALLRRSTQRPTTESITAAAREGSGPRLDLATHSANWRGRTIALDIEEYKVLDYLLSHVREPVPLSDLVEHLWEPGRGSEELLKVHLRRLREKLEEDADRPRLLRPLDTHRLVLDPGEEKEAGDS
jgi:DNA-binding response OmpR family regulator